MHVNKVRIDCVPDYGEFDKSQRDAAGQITNPFLTGKPGRRNSSSRGHRPVLSVAAVGPARDARDVLPFFTVTTHVKSGMPTSRSGWQLTGLAIPTLGSVAWAHEKQFRLLWSVTNSTWDGDDRSVMMGISFLECLLAVIFVVLVGWLSTELIENIGV